MTWVCSSVERCLSVSSMRSRNVPAGVAGVEPVEQGGAGAADVQVARGGGGEADADSQWGQGSGVRGQVSRSPCLSPDTWPLTPAIHGGGGDSNPR